MAFTHTSYEGLNLEESSRALYEICYAINEREKFVGRGPASSCTITGCQCTSRAGQSPWMAAMGDAAAKGYTGDGIGEPYIHWLCHDNRERAFPTWEEWSGAYTGQDIPDDFEDWFPEISGARSVSVNDYITDVMSYSSGRAEEFRVPVYGINPQTPNLGQWSRMAAINAQRIFIAFGLHTPEAGPMRRHDWVKDLESFFQLSSEFSARYSSSIFWNYPPFGLQWMRAFGEGGEGESFRGFLEWARSVLEDMTEITYFFSARPPHTARSGSGPIGKSWNRYVKQTGDDWIPYDLYTGWAPQHSFEDYWTSMAGSEAEQVPASVAGAGGAFITHQLGVDLIKITSPYMHGVSHVSQGNRLRQIAELIWDSFNTGWVCGDILSSGIPVRTGGRLSFGSTYRLGDGVDRSTPNVPELRSVEQTFWVSLDAIGSPSAVMEKDYKFNCQPLYEGFLNGTSLIKSFYANAFVEVGCAKIELYNSRLRERLGGIETFNHVITNISSELTYG